jgi:hypothetical protein
MTLTGLALQLLWLGLPTDLQLQRQATMVES